MPNLPPKWIAWRVLKQKLYASHVGTVAGSLAAFLDRFHRYNAILHPAQRAELAGGLLLRACKRLARVAPSSCIALLRFFVGGWPESTHRWHSGDCCFCLGWHLVRSPQVTLLNGCFYEELSGTPGWRWMREYPRMCVLPLMRACLVSWKATHRFASLLRLLASRRWACVHAREPLQALHLDAKQLLLH